MSVKQAKPAPYHPDKRSIGELLATTNPPLVVPPWQRSYSWTISHVETFWNDLHEFSRRHPGVNIDQREYFLGSVVIVTTSSSEHLLLDGQQRLATSVILLSVIRDQIRKYKSDAAQRIQMRYLADFDDAKNVLVYKLGLNIYDRDYFKRKILEERNSAYQDPIAELASHNLIHAAREYFWKLFEEANKQFKTPEEAYQWALRVQNVLLNHMSVVAITSTDEDSAAEVFETLNDRGIGLSTPDLLRNLVIRRAAAGAQDEIVDLWSEIIEFETDTEIKAFLRHFWISRHGDVKTQRLYREIKGHIEGGNIPSLSFSRELRDSAIVYRDIVAAKDDDQNVEESLKAIAELGATVLYPLVLSIMECVPEDNKEHILDVLLSLYVRHSVIGQLENSKLENVIHKVASDLRTSKDVALAMKALSEFAPTDDAFSLAFQRVSITRTATQRYLLRALELEKRSTEELNVNPPSKVHVEHIYPQTPLLGHKWSNHAQALNRLGNLTLLSKSLNVTIKNSVFEKKLPYYEKSEIIITKDLTKSQSWDVAAIDARQKTFADLAPVIWSV